MIDSDAGTLLVAPDRIGRAKRIDSAQERYIEYAKRTLPRDSRLNGLRVVIDCANGAGYQVAPDVLWELGAEVIKIGVEPNGLNINEKCGSTDPEALCAKVREMRADIGIGLDGDADRVAIVDEKGSIVDGDQIMAVIAESWHRRGLLAGGGVVATVMSNLGLERYFNDLGLRLRARRSAIAMSWSTCASTASTSAASSRATSFSPISPRPATGSSPRCRCCPWSLARAGPSAKCASASRPCRSCLQNVRYANGSPLDHDTVKSAIDLGKERLGKSGRLVIRPSGTEPVIRVMAEGDDERLVQQVVGDIVEAVRKVAQPA